MKKTYIEPQLNLTVICLGTLLSGSMFDPDSATPQMATEDDAANAASRAGSNWDE